jgi:hypothetical protein
MSALPDPLDPHLRHAERLVRALTELEADLAVSRWADRDAPSEPELWVLGRAAEVEAFVVDVVREVTDGTIAREAAAVALGRYLRLVNDGLSARLGTCAARTHGGPPSTKDMKDVTTRAAPLAAAYAVASELASTTQRDT